MKVRCMLAAIAAMGISAGAANAEAQAIGDPWAFGRSGSCAEAIWVHRTPPGDAGVAIGQVGLNLVTYYQAKQRAMLDTSPRYAGACDNVSDAQVWHVMCSLGQLSGHFCVVAPQPHLPDASVAPPPAAPVTPVVEVRERVVYRDRVRVEYRDRPGRGSPAAPVTPSGTATAPAAPPPAPVQPPPPPAAAPSAPAAPPRQADVAPDGRPLVPPRERAAASGPRQG